MAAHTRIGTFASNHSGPRLLLARPGKLRRRSNSVSFHRYFDRTQSIRRRQSGGLRCRGIQAHTDRDEECYQEQEAECPRLAHRDLASVGISARWVGRRNVAYWHEAAAHSAARFRPLSRLKGTSRPAARDARF